MWGILVIYYLLLLFYRFITPKTRRLVIFVLLCSYCNFEAETEGPETAPHASQTVGTKNQERTTSTV